MRVHVAVAAAVMAGLVAVPQASATVQERLDVDFAVTGTASITFDAVVSVGAPRIVEDSQGRLIAAAVASGTTATTCTGDRPTETRWIAITRLTPAGEPDTTFGVNGRELVCVGVSTSGLGDLAVLPDGRIRLLTWTGSELRTTTLLASGPLDPSTPIVTMSVPGGASVLEPARFAADGKVIALDDAARRVIRYSADGLLDPTFGGSGAVTVSSDTTVVLDEMMTLADGTILVFRRDADDSSVVAVGPQGAVSATTSYDGLARVGGASMRVTKVASSSVGTLVVGSLAGFGSVYELVDSAGQLVPWFGTGGRLIAGSAVDAAIDTDGTFSTVSSISTKNGTLAQFTRRFADGVIDESIGQSSPLTAVTVGLDEQFATLKALADARIAIGHSLGSKLLVTVVERPGRPLTPRSPRRIQIAGRGGVPSDARDVFVNLTSARATGAGFLSLRSCAATGDPTTSSLNYRAAEIVFDHAVANSALVHLDADGAVCIWSSAHDDALIDVQGWVIPGAAGIDASSPRRVLDTRAANGGAGPITGGTQRRVVVAGQAGVPADARTVLVNLTAAGTTASGYFSLRSCLATGTPTTSTVNWQRGIDVANHAVVQLDADGSICIFASSRAEALLDVVAAVSATTPPIVTTTPQRITDTRRGSGGAGPVAAGASLKVQVRGVSAIPAGATAVFVNLTGDGASTAGYLSTRSCADTSVPQTSTLNFDAKQATANQTLVRLDADGAFCVYASVATDVIVDLQAYADPVAIATTSPARLLDTRVPIP